MTSSSPLPDFDVLSGTWESPVLEPMPLPDGGQMFLTRTGEVGPITVLPAITNAICSAAETRFRFLALSSLGFSLA